MRARVEKYRKRIDPNEDYVIGCILLGRIECRCEQNRKKRARVKLADGKEGAIQHMMCTSFWHPDGTPMSAEQLMEQFVREAAGNSSKTKTSCAACGVCRKQEKRCCRDWQRKVSGTSNSQKMQRIISAEKSDLFDVLAYVAYAEAPVTRIERADGARVHIIREFSAKQQEFLEFVLRHYVAVGVEELEQEKLNPLLKLRYQGSIQMQWRTSEDQTKFGSFS